MFEDVKEHPSYATIGWSRASGGNVTLFGSDLKHNEVIRIELHEADIARDLHRDWIHNKNLIIEVEMSPTQFAEFLTSPNRGTGVPCTIKHREGHGRVEGPTFEPKVEVFKREFVQDLKELDTVLTKMVSKAASLVEAPRIGKKDIKELNSLVTKVQMELKSNLPFLYEQFAKNMSAIVQTAKTEVEAYTERRIREAGLVAIEKDVPKLLETTNIEGEENSRS